MTFIFFNRKLIKRTVLQYTSVILNTGLPFSLLFLADQPVLTSKCAFTQLQNNLLMANALTKLHLEEPMNIEVTLVSKRSEKNILSEMRQK
jgi:hypothetical protein